jgi:hypothetical protein
MHYHYLDEDDEENGNAAPFKWTQTFLSEHSYPITWCVLNFVSRKKECVCVRERERERERERGVYVCVCVSVRARSPSE